MRVEVDIFSGRPSPFWTASPQEAEALTDRLRLLTGISSRLEEDGGRWTSAKFSLPALKASRNGSS